MEEFHELNVVMNIPLLHILDFILKHAANH